MAKRDFSGRIGDLITTSAPGEKVQAYVPKPLPPDPPVDVNEMSGLISKAMLELGRLDGLKALVPDTPLFLYMYVRKEALLSSQIEGTQSTLSDLLLYENEAAPGAPVDDVEEVSTYVAALNHGLNRLASGFPLSTRLLREMHEILLSTGRGSTKQPGEFRRSQNWIGGTRPGNALFVPPPPEQIADCMSNLEAFLHETESGLPPLLKAGIAHVQFETIHPFLDGNGRLGRLLVTLLLCDAGILEEPLLYLSLYLKTNRKKYYDLLQEVREHGTWESWLEFFLNGVIEVATQANKAARQISKLFTADSVKVAEIAGNSHVVKTVHEALQKRPIMTVAKAAEAAGTTFPTANKALEKLEEAGIAKEITGKKRGRIYTYTAYLDIMNEGTEPL